MNQKTARLLCALNSSFYEEHAASFSATRQAPWSGWTRCVELLRELEFGLSGTSLSVFDLACGNLRFESFLAHELSATELQFFAVDNCDALVPAELAGQAEPTESAKPSLHYQNLDLTDLLLRGLSLHEHLDAPPCDLAVCFGFLHHVPCAQYRKELLLSLIETTKPGGLVIVSLWQFMRNEALRIKALAAHARALEELEPYDLRDQLDENDVLLGWQDKPRAFRYCHHFSDAEIDDLIDAVKDHATPVARFVADGRSNNLNSYVVLRRACPSS
jgi:SAM-dependent methyltransferase